MSRNVLRLSLLLLTLALCGLGLVMVGSTTTIRGAVDSALNFRALNIQSAALIIGSVIAVVISLCGLNFLRKGWLLYSVTAVVLLMLAVAPFVAAPVNGAYRWFDVGPIKIQPAELAKIILILFAAAYLVKQQERVRVHWHGVLVPLMGFGFVALLVYRTQDLGSVVVMGSVLYVMMFFARARWIYFTLLGIASLPLLLYVTVFSEGYRRDRMLAFWDPWAVEGPAAHHLQQAQMAIGSGGTHGMGLGQGASKQGFLPEFHTDFIYAIICEELGMIGGVIVVLAYLLYIMVGLGIAHRCGNGYARLVAVGATILLGFQAFWNMLVVTNTVPTKGLTLPFISYGGTSLVVSLILVGLLDAAARTIPRTVSVKQRSDSRIGAAVLRPNTQSTQSIFKNRMRPWEL